MNLIERLKRLGMLPGGMFDSSSFWRSRSPLLTALNARLGFGWGSVPKVGLIGEDRILRIGDTQKSKGEISFRELFGDYMQQVHEPETRTFGELTERWMNYAYQQAPSESLSLEEITGGNDAEIYYMDTAADDQGRIHLVCTRRAAGAMLAFAYYLEDAKDGNIISADAINLSSEDYFDHTVAFGAGKCHPRVICASIGDYNAAQVLYHGYLRAEDSELCYYVRSEVQSEPAEFLQRVVGRSQHIKNPFVLPDSEGNLHVLFTAHAQTNHGNHSAFYCWRNSAMKWSGRFEIRPGEEEGEYTLDAMGDGSTTMTFDGMGRLHMMWRVEHFQRPDRSILRYAMFDPSGDEPEIQSINFFSRLPIPSNTLYPMLAYGSGRVFCVFGEFSDSDPSTNRFNWIEATDYEITAGQWADGISTNDLNVIPRAENEIVFNREPSMAIIGSHLVLAYAFYEGTSPDNIGIRLRWKNLGTDTWSAENDQDYYFNNYQFEMIKSVRIIPNPTNGSFRLGFVGRTSSTAQNIYLTTDQITIS